MPHLLRMTAVIVLGSLALAGCTDQPDAEPLQVGELVTEALKPVPGAPARVRLPVGGLDFTVSSPRERWEPPGAQEPRSAPEGGSLVGVGWRWRAEEYDPAVFVEGDEEPEIEVALEVGGKSYPITSAVRPDERTPGLPFELSGTVWVGVPLAPGDVEDPVVTVTFDGVRQVADPDDPHGQANQDTRAASLYLRPMRHSGTFDCQGPLVAGRPSSGSCLVQVDETPWHSAVGWSNDGRPWVVVTFRGSLGPGVPGPGGYRPWALEGDLRVLSTLDGLAPVEAVRDGVKGWGDEDSVGDVLVFEPGTAGDFVARTTVSTQGPGGGRVPVTWRTRFN